MVATIGTIPALTEYQPGGLPLAGDERLEITSTGSATTAASYQMKVKDTAKVVGVLPFGFPSPSDLVAYLHTADGTPHSTLISTLVNATAGSGFNVVVVSSGATANVAVTTDVLVLNKNTTTVVNLPLSALYTRTYLEIYCWSGLEGDVKVVPNGADAGGIMGLAAWTVTSLGVTGGGGSLRLVPVSSLNGWAAR
jgi:hypothetical protein